MGGCMSIPKKNILNDPDDLLPESREIRIPAAEVFRTAHKSITTSGGAWAKTLSPCRSAIRDASREIRVRFAGFAQQSVASFHRTGRRSSGQPAFIFETSWVRSHSILKCSVPGPHSKNSTQTIEIQGFRPYLRFRHEVCICWLPKQRDRHEDRSQTDSRLLQAGTAPDRGPGSDSVESNMDCGGY